MADRYTTRRSDGTGTGAVPWPRRSPLDGLGRRVHGSVSLAATQPAALFHVQGVEESALRAAQAPCTPLWLGPDRWMLVSEERTPAELAAKLASLPEDSIAIDVGHGWARIRIDGPGAGELLQSGIPLDLGPAAWSVGNAGPTAYRDVPVLLHAAGPARFDVYAFRSLALSLWEWLDDAARTL